MAISELDEIVRDAKRVNALVNYQPDQSALKTRLAPNTAVGDALRNAPMPNQDELRQRLAPAPAAEPARAPRAVALNPAQAPGSIADLSRPFVQQQAAPASNPNVAKGVLSAQGRDFVDEQAKRAAKTTAPAAAPAPVTAPAAGASPAKPSTYRTIVNAASESARPLVPATGGAGGVISKAAGVTAAAGVGLAKRAVPFVEPAIEAARVARVAMDPQATQLDVATQGAEGVGRTASTIAGAGLGGAAGAAVGGPFAPLTGAIGGIAGAVAGYVGGDQAIKALRRSVGLDTPSPVERTDARTAAAAAPPLISQTAAPPTITPAPTAAATAAPATAPATIESAARKPGRAAQPAPAAQVGDGTPAIGNGSVEIYRGSQRTVAVPNGAGGYVEVDGAVFDAGRTREALQAQGRDAAMTPLDRAQALERTKDEATLKAAQIQAGVSSGNNANTNLTLKEIANMSKGKDNLVVVPGGEILSPDGFTKIKVPSMLYDTQAKQYVSLPTAPKDAYTDPKALAIKNNNKLSNADKQKQLQALGY